MEVNKLSMALLKVKIGETMTTLSARLAALSTHVRIVCLPCSSMFRGPRFRQHILLPVTQCKRVGSGRSTANGELVADRSSRDVR